MNEPEHGPPYQPIDCDRYSEYEVAILKRRPVLLRWREDNVIYEQSVTPVDLKTENHEEFLIVRLSDATTRAIRLDCILALEAT